MDREGGVERPVRPGVTAAWAKSCEISGLLCNRRSPLKSKANSYDAYIRLVVLYGRESWSLSQRLEKCILSSNRRLLRDLSVCFLTRQGDLTELWAERDIGGSGSEKLAEVCSRKEKKGGGSPIENTQLACGSTSSTRETHEVVDERDPAGCQEAGNQ